MVQKIQEDKEVFEEFYNYLFSGEYCNSEWDSVEAAGYGARRLVEKEGFTPVAAYRFLVELREKALRSGMARKK